MAKVPVTASVLRWAVDDAGLTVESLANILEKPEKLIESWLEGDDKPHRGDLLRLSRAVGRPPQFFFRSDAPKESDQVKSNKRSPIGSDHDGNESASELKAVRAAENIRKVAAWSAALEGEPPIEFPAVSSDAETYAARLRKWLSWDTLEFQVRLGSKAATFKRLRAEIEAAGVVVLVMDFGSANSRGFSIVDDIAPVIVINGSIDLASVKTYTLLHELTHLCRGSVTLHHDKDPAVERWCERVAAHFLLPQEDLDDYIEKRRKKDFFLPSDIEPHVRLISLRYKASWHSVAIRLKELGYADQRLVDAVAEGGEIDVPGRSVVPQTRPVKRLAEFGMTYPRLILAAVGQKRLSDVDARRYLRLTSGAELAQVGSLVQVGA